MYIRSVGAFIRTTGNDAKMYAVTKVSLYALLLTNDNVSITVYKYNLKSKNTMVAQNRANQLLVSVIRFFCIYLQPRLENEN